MTLREYLFYKQMNLKEFSLLIGYNPAYVSSVSLGKHKPTKRMIKAIIEACEGHVKEDEIYKPLSLEKTA